MCSMRCFRSKKPPPLHTGADWKVVLHLPEIEKWLRATSDRVTQLTHSVGQDSDNRHVDVHLVQLKVGRHLAGSPLMGLCTFMDSFAKGCFYTHFVQIARSLTSSSYAWTYHCPLKLLCTLKDCCCRSATMNEIIQTDAHHLWAEATWRCFYCL